MTRKKERPPDPALAPELQDSAYMLDTLPPWEPWVTDDPMPKRALAWSGVGGFASPPAIGTRVRINFNKLGAGVVVGYFREYGFLGVEVQIDKRPAWHKKQCPGNGRDVNPLVFGAEIEPETKR